jgi:peptide/nickel transport system substrate-binding protein
MAINRQAIVDGLYGPAGEAATFYINGPKRYLPDSGAFTYDLRKAGELLDAAGWIRGSDGVRAKNSVRMKVLYQTTVSPIRQNIQAIVKKDLESIGFQVELKQIPSSAYFSNDPANPDTWQKFSADIEEFSSSVGVPEPLTYLLQYTSGQIAQKANGWAFRNSARYSNSESDSLWNAANVEIDPEKRTTQIKRMVQILYDDVALQPVVHQHPVAAVKNGVQGIVLHAFDANLGAYRTGTARCCRRRRAVTRYLARRALLAIPTLLGISLLLFVILSLAPGDPFSDLATNPNVPPDVRDRLRQSLGLNDPVIVQYFHWLASLAQGS